jgi:hypothetical protein
VNEAQVRATKPAIRFQNMSATPTSALRTDVIGMIWSGPTYARMIGDLVTRPSTVLAASMLCES